MPAALDFVPHYTIRDFSLWKGDWELWEGTAIAMTPRPFGVHQRIVTRLSRAIGNAIEASACQAEVIVDLDWIILEDTIVRPDIVVVCGLPPECYLEKSPSIVVEVLSESTRQNDLNYKRQLYHREGVAAYLMVDPEARSIQVDRRQSDGNYTTEISVSEIAMRLCEDCEIRFHTLRIFSQ